MAITLMFALTSSSFVVADEQCQARQLKALYTISTHSSPEHHQHAHRPSPKEQLLLWRNNSQVAIEYPNTHITELWEQTKNKQLRLVRNFDAQKRGIEYQPNEVGGEHDWSVKNQLIAESLRQRMQLVKSSGSGCDQQQFYTLSENGVSYELSWLPQRHLMARFTVTKAESLTEWTLASLDSDAKHVEQRFLQLSSYDTTDYTDIGDNESDPFLRKMIHLGFVEHGGSGFYDSNGNQLGGHHH